MSKKENKKLREKLGFERRRDRIFSIIIPAFLCYLLVAPQHSETIKLVALVVLVGFATGQGSMVVLYLAKTLGGGTIGGSDEKAPDNNNDSPDTASDDDNNKQGE